MKYVYLIMEKGCSTFLLKCHPRKLIQLTRKTKLSNRQEKSDKIDENTWMVQIRSKMKEILLYIWLDYSSCAHICAYTLYRLQNGVANDINKCKG